MKRNIYNENYKKVTSLKENKKTKDDYIYIGDYYNLDAGKKNVKVVKAKMAAFAVMAFFIYFLLGFINNAGSHLVYIALPFVISFLPLAFMLIATIQLVLKRENLSVFDYQKVWIRIKITGIATLVLIIMSIIGDLFFLILHFNSIPRSKELYFLLGCTLLVVFAFAILHFQNQLKCAKIETENNL